MLLVVPKKFEAVIPLLPDKPQYEVLVLNVDTGNFLTTPDEIVSTLSVELVVPAATPIIVKGVVPDAGTICIADVGLEVPTPTRPALSIIIRSTLLVLKARPTLSVVPKKLLALLVPLLPVKDQPDAEVDKVDQMGLAGVPIFTCRALREVLYIARPVAGNEIRSR